MNPFLTNYYEDLRSWNDLTSLKYIWRALRKDYGFESFDMELYRSFLRTDSTQKTLAESNHLEAKLAIIHRINEDNNYFIFEGPTLEGLAHLGRKKLRRLHKLFNNVEFHRDMTEVDFEDFITKIFVITQGGGRTIGDFIFKNKDQRFRETLFRIAKDQMLREGFESFLISQPLNPKKTMNQKRLYYGKKIKNRLYKIFQAKVIKQIKGLPFILPKISNTTLNDAMIYDLIMKGADRANPRLLKLYQSQSKIENYRIFKRIYSSVAIVGLIYLYSEMIYDDIEMRVIEIVKKVEKGLIHRVEKLKEVAYSIEREDKAIEEIEKEWNAKILERSLKSFREKWADGPTELEYGKMYFEIYGLPPGQ